MSDGQLNEVPESEKMLAQIEAAKQASSSKAENSSESVNETAQSPSEAPEQKTEENVAPEKSGQAISQTEAQENPDKPEDDIKKWAKKKGILEKDPEDIFRSLRNLEQKLGKTTAALKAKEQPMAQPQWQPQPQFQQPYQQPSYPPYMDREKIIEQEAAKRGWDKEDFRKILDLNSELLANQARQLKAEFSIELQEVKKETRRNSELNELSQDPYFRDERVQFEMHKVLEENPQAFAHEPMPYRYAFDEAQRRLARKYLEGEPQTRENPYPTNPPKDGSKSVGFEKKTPNDVLEAFSKAKTSEEQRKVLTSLGAVQSL